MVIPATLPGESPRSVEPAEGKAETGIGEGQGPENTVRLSYWTQPRPNVASSIFSTQIGYLSVVKCVPDFLIAIKRLTDTR